MHRVRDYAGPDKATPRNPSPGGPVWMREPLQDAVFHQRGVDTIGISRKTGRVYLWHEES